MTKTVELFGLSESGAEFEQMQRSKVIRFADPDTLKVQDVE